MTGQRYRRNQYPFTYGTCQLCRRPGVRLITDHCHAHGWVRGRICESCNGYMRVFDEGAGTAGLPARYAEHWHRCPDCAASGESPYERSYRQASEAIEWQHSPACGCPECAKMPQ